MSLVLAFATNDFAVMAGDSRRTHIQDDNIHFDDTPKAFKLNPKVLGGFTGDCDVTKYLVAELQGLNENSTIEAAARKVKQLIKRFPREDIYQSVILNGISDSGKFAIIKLTHRNNFKLERINVPTGEIKWMCALSYVDPMPIIDDKYRALSECNFTNIAELAKTVIEEVSETDIRVSKTCDVIGIVK